MQEAGGEEKEEEEEEEMNYIEGSESFFCRSVCPHSVGKVRVNRLRDWLDRLRLANGTDVV